MSDGFPVLTIVTVTKNSGRTLEQAVKSVCRQKDNRVEYILIDGNSTDSTREILEGHKECLDIVVIEEDEGLYFAMNKGVDLAKGKYISFLNADDYYLENSLAKILSILEVNTSKSYVAEIELVDQNSTLSVPVTQIYHRMIPHPGLFLLTESMRTLGGFDTSFSVAADYELVCRIISQGHIIENLNFPVAAHRSGGYSQQRQVKSIFETFKIQRKYYKKRLLHSLYLFLKSLIHAGIKK